MSKSHGARSGRAADGGAAAAAAARPPATVRMYNVGFGDCFLVRFPTSSGVKKVLIDCGSLGKAPRPMSAIVTSVIEDLRDPDGVPRVDVLVVTHRHRDHISGFAAPGWDELEVKEVWMPWTEHPTDPVARRIREAQSRASLALAGAVAAMPPAAREEGQGFLAALNAAGSDNDRAMRLLHRGFVGSPQRRFLPERPKRRRGGGPERPPPRTLETPVLPGVVVHLMGPPHDEDVIRDMDPPKNSDASYLRLAAATAGVAAATDEPEPPFGPEWEIPPAHKDVKKVRAGLFGAEDRKRITELGAESGLAALVALDKAVNGTSLMLMFEVGDAFMLFPGDAQWGTWQAVLADPEWRALVKRTTFLKVGHHASHNATPREFVEDVLGEDIPAVVSVHPVANWPSIPRGPLVEALRGKVRLVRSDELEDEMPDGFAAAEGLEYVDVTVPT